MISKSYFSKNILFLLWMDIFFSKSERFGHWTMGSGGKKPLNGVNE